MRIRTILIIGVIGILSLTTGITAHGEETGTIRHRLLLLDFWKGKLHYVNQFDPTKDWAMPVGGGVQDMQLIGGQRILVTHDSGFTIYSLETQKQVERVQLPTLAGTTTARRLPDGRTLVGTNQKAGVTVFTLDKANQVEGKVVIPGLKMLRTMRLTKRGTLLLSENDGASEVTIAPEMPDENRVLRRFKMPRSRNAFMSIEKPDGNVLVSGGYAQGLFEFKPDGTLVREFQAKQPEGLVNWFYGGFQILKNGHIVQSNWTGHGKQDYKPGWKVIEFDQNGEVVWHWYEPERAGTIYGVIVLDEIDTGVLNDDAGGILQGAGKSK